MIRMIFKTCVCILLLAASPPMAAAQQDGLYDGLWQSRGYAQILEIDGTDVTVWQHAGGTVMPSALERGHIEGNILHWTYVNWGAETEFRLVRTGGNLAIIEAETDRRTDFRRIESLPPSQPATNDPLLNFDYFWTLLDEVYAAFETRGVDWDAVRAEYRPQVTSETTDDELFQIFSDMLATFGADGHTWINDGNGRSFSPFSATDHAPPGLTRRDVLPVVRQHYLTENPTAMAQDNIFFGPLRDHPDIGYINVLEVSELAEEARPAADMAAIREVVKALRDFGRDKQAIILDVRNNSGGFDSVSRHLAALFADQTRLGYSKRVRLQGTDNFMDAQIFFIEPLADNLADKPLAILQGTFTASGAEILLMSMMQFEQARRFGLPSMGVLSDTMQRELPNGWMLSTYSEQYFTHDSRNYEGQGIPADVLITNPGVDTETGTDPILDAAIEWLNGRQ